MPSLKATEFVRDEQRWLRCHYCGYEWPPRVEAPKQCPSCKRHIYMSDEMEEITRNRVLKKLPELRDIKEVVPDIFTPQCVSCGEDATAQYKKMFYCGRCVVQKMKGDGVLEE